MNGRMQRRVALVVGAATAAAGAAGGVVLRRPIGDRLLRRAVRRALTRENLHLADGLHAALGGTGSPLPDRHRAGPCVAVLAGEHLFVVDAGEGSTRNLMLMRLPVGRVEAVLLTHFHSDHMADLGELELQRWMGGSNASPLEVFGPTGVEQVVQGFNDAYALDAGYRVAHHGAVTAPPTGAGGVARPFEMPADPNGSVVVLERDDVRITAFAVDHRPAVPAVGYRIDYRGRSVVISGDTASSESLPHNAAGADVLIHEALNPAMVRLINEEAGLAAAPSLGRVTHDIPSYHTSPGDAARIAAAARVRHLVLYHLIPPLESALVKRMFLGSAPGHFDGPITIGEDGMLISLPAGTQQIEITNLLR